MIAERESEINILTQDVLELNELFRLFGDIVRGQGEQCDLISDHADTILDNAQGAERALTAASQHQEAVQRWKAWLLWNPPRVFTQFGPFPLVCLLALACMLTRAGSLTLFGLLILAFWLTVTGVWNPLVLLTRDGLWTLAGKLGVAFFAAIFS